MCRRGRGQSQKSPAVEVLRASFVSTTTASIALHIRPTLANRTTTKTVDAYSTIASFGSRLKAAICSRFEAAFECLGRERTVHTPVEVKSWGLYLRRVGGCDDNGGVPAGAAARSGRSWRASPHFHRVQGAHVGRGSAHLGEDEGLLEQRPLDNEVKGLDFLPCLPEIGAGHRSNACASCISCRPRLVLDMGAYTALVSCPCPALRLLSRKIQHSSLVSKRRWFNTS